MPDEIKPNNTETGTPNENETETRETGEVKPPENPKPEGSSTGYKLDEDDSWRGFTEWTRTTIGNLNDKLDQILTAPKPNSGQSTEVEEQSSRESPNQQTQQNEQEHREETETQTGVQQPPETVTKRSSRLKFRIGQ